MQSRSREFHREENRCFMPMIEKDMLDEPSLLRNIQAQWQRIVEYFRGIGVRKKDYVLAELKSSLIKILMTDILIQAEVRGQKLPVMLTIFFLRLKTKYKYIRWLNFSHLIEMKIRIYLYTSKSFCMSANPGDDTNLAQRKEIFSLFLHLLLFM